MLLQPQSIGEPGTQLTLRTFHVGGTASRSAVDASVVIKKPGVIVIDDLRTINTTDENGNTIELVISRSAELRVIDPKQISLSLHTIYHMVRPSISRKVKLKKVILFVIGIRIMLL